MVISTFLNWGCVFQSVRFAGDAFGTQKYVAATFKSQNFWQRFQEPAVAAKVLGTINRYSRVPKPWRQFSRFLKTSHTVLDFKKTGINPEVSEASATNLEHQKPQRQLRVLKTSLVKFLS